MDPDDYVSIYAGGNPYATDTTYDFLGDLPTEDPSLEEHPTDPISPPFIGDLPTEDPSLEEHPEEQPLKTDTSPKISAELKNFLKGLIVGDDGKVNPMGAFGIAALMSTLGLGRSSPAPVGYQGGIPRYTAVRQQVSGLGDVNRRPGSGGRRYFSDTTYVDPTKTAELQAAKTAAQTQASGLAALNKANPFYETRPKSVMPEEVKKEETSTKEQPQVASKVIEAMPVPKYDEKGNVIAAYGGLMNLARGRYLNGSTDGMADKIPANIEGKQEARLSHGEFVIPADVVSHLGNGNSEAGAQELYSMMDRIRKARTGNPKQGKQIAPSKYLPS